MSNLKIIKTPDFKEPKILINGIDLCKLSDTVSDVTLFIRPDECPQLMLTMDIIGEIDLDTDVKTMCVEPDMDEI